MLPTSSQSAETSVTIPSPMTPEIARALMAELSDADVRALLLQQLDAVADQTAPQAAARSSVIDRLANLWGSFTTPVRLAVGRIGTIPDATNRAIAQFIETHGGPGSVLALFGMIAAIVLAAYGIELLSRRLIKVSEVNQVSQDAGLVPALSYLARRFFREILGLIVFYVSLRIIGSAVLTPVQLAFAGPMVANLIWFPRLAAACSRFLLAPEVPALRLVNADDAGATFLYRHLVGLVLWSGITMFTVSFYTTNGIPTGETYIGFWLDSFVYIYLIWIIWSARDTLRQMMLGKDPDRTEFDIVLSNNFPFYGIVVTLGIWVLVQTLLGSGNMAEVLAGAHYATLFWLLIAPVIDTAIRGLVRHLVPPMIGEGPVAERAHLATKRSYIRIGRVIAIGAILFVIAGVWDVSFSTLIQDGAGIGDNVFRFLLTVVVGYLVYEGSSLWVNRQLAAEQTARGMTMEDADAETGGPTSSRLSTVLPLLLMTTRTTVVIIFGLLAIGNLGIDITPLLAGAGILGLAIGFGAQKLVSDVVSGVFFLIDDAFRVGEYVDIDGTMGAVEKISIRSMQLRHHRGAVHTIPYGEIPKLTNFSRDWVIMKLKFTVPFDTDPNKIKKIFKRIGAEMMEDPLYKDDFLQPFKSQGVFDIDDVGMVIRGKFMTKPGKQFMIRKEIFNKVKAYFEEAGIEFARREVRVALPGHDAEHELSEVDQATIAAAAAQNEQPNPA